MAIQFTMNADVLTFSAKGLVGADGTEIFFDLNINAADRLRVMGSPRSSMVQPLRVAGYIRSDGRMYDTKAVSPVPYDVTDPGNVGVRLLADDPNFELENPVTYHISGGRQVNGAYEPFPEWDTAAVPSTDTPANLADFYAGPRQTNP